MEIHDLDPADDVAIEQAARMLVEGFKEHWPESWPDMDSALDEVRRSFGDDRISRVMVGDDGAVLGWIGGIRQYEGLVWELHPLVIRPDQQRRGIGRALVADFEDQVRRRGALTVFLGTDDVDGLTTLSGIDLYRDLWQRVSSIANPGGHPYEFYQKLGYVVVGVVPDANGWGKPDILMAKRVG